jgi:nucleoside-diphosphate-sugar epimerase
MRVLIVGCGYIGLPLGAALGRQKHHVFGLCRSPSGEEAIRKSGITPLLADITQPKALAMLPSGYDRVVHCVASGGGNAEEYRRLYVDGTRNLLRWLGSGPPPDQIIYTSSTNVYGQNDGSWVDECSAMEPSSDTARILVEAEQLVLSRTNDFAGVVLRLAGIYGPDRGHWFKQFLRDQAELEAGGERILNMIHREDVIGCILAAFERGRPGELYNAVDDEPVSQLHFFEWLADKLEKPMPPMDTAPSGERKRGATNKKVSNRKLKAEFGYEFKYPTFREGYAAELAGF